MRRRISWLVLITTSTIVAAFVVPLCLLVRTLAEDRAMAAADQEAGNIAALVAGRLDAANLGDVVDTRNAAGDVRLTVYTADDQVLGDGATPRTDGEVRRALGGEGVTTVDDRGGRVLLPVVTPDGTAVVRASVTVDVLRAGVTRAWASIIGLGIALMAVAAFIASLLGRRISEPLYAVAAVAHRLREGDLSARAEVDGTEETEELARALNGLAERTRELLAAERGAVADLSHRLRTPVTALRLDAEAVPDAELARRLGEHIGVLQRSIDAIVRDARRPVREDLRERCDAAAVVRDRVAFWRALADDQGRPVQVTVPEKPVVVPLAADDLADVVDVLVDNVFAHTPEPVGFGVRLVVSEASARLEVVDEGDGPSGVRQEREGSTGLGLDIARRAAAAAGGSLTFGARPEGGTEVDLVLPLVTD
ncbi:sensor histidine kinase [Nocardioides halotolerans]|uniref:sensor histidine kinase n=1 Tax=Nocardioides halotolerans TaxID=433660 RepID=UPI0003FA15A4|nr:HAMP domain-containing sensor histidine kinase [Nocardioides halotolerans]